MDNKASPMEERALTNAIERAATVASINEGLDRNQLLADQLKKNSVDPKFAKTASAAFNKRLTVLTLKKADDEHKADPFALTDADTVYRLVSGETPEIKVASAIPYTMDIETASAPMEKAASVSIDAPELWEHRVDADIVERHIEGLLDKHAHIFAERVADISRFENQVDAEAREVASEFEKKAFDFDFTTAVNIHGDKLKDALTGYVPENVSFERTCEHAITPSKPIFKKVAALIADKQKLEEDKQFLDEYGTSLVEFSNTAKRFGDAMLMAKTAAPKPTIPQPVNPNLPARVQQQPDPTLPMNKVDLANARYQAAQQAQSTAAAQLALAQQNYNQMRQNPQDAYNEANVEFFGGALPNVLAGGGASLLAAATNLQKSVYDAGLSTLSNAYNMYQTGKGGANPSDVLDADFLVRDRYHDRMMAWSDMTADPQFSMYPAEEVWNAVNKAMNIDMSLERPDRREVLRAYVGQLLAQNNRVSTADIAALATTLKGLEATGGNAAAMAAASANALPSVERKELPALKDPLAGIKTDKLEDFARDSIERAKESEKAYNTIMHDLAKDDEDRAKKELDSAKQRADRMDEAVFRAGERQQDANVALAESIDRENQRLQNEYQKQLESVNRQNAQIGYQNTIAGEKWDKDLRKAVLDGLGYRLQIDRNNGGVYYVDRSGQHHSLNSVNQIIANANPADYGMPARP